MDNKPPPLSYQKLLEITSRLDGEDQAYVLRFLTFNDGKVRRKVKELEEERQQVSRVKFKLQAQVIRLKKVNPTEWWKSFKKCVKDLEATLHRVIIREPEILENGSFGKALRCLIDRVGNLLTKLGDKTWAKERVVATEVTPPSDCLIPSTPLT